MQTYATVYANMLRPNKYYTEFRVEECFRVRALPFVTHVTFPYYRIHLTGLDVLLSNRTTDITLYTANY